MKILVAMSGGVDSTTAALLLRRAGHEVAGAHLAIWRDDPSPCDASARPCGAHRASRDAALAAESLGIPCYTFRCEETFRRTVLDPFVAAYRRARTPNPCILCNRHVKFGFLLERALALDFDAVATGHHARIERDGARFRLLRGRDARKDQSYFLFLLGPRELRRVLLPIGRHTKDEVRRIARDAALAVAERSESQEICFAASGDYRDLVPRGEPGPIVDTAGRVLGTHEGLEAYTIGQRRGLGIAAGRPVYVCRLDAEGNRVVVGDREDCLAPAARVEQLHWTAGERPADRFEAEVRIRHMHRPAPAVVEVEDGGGARAAFREPQFAVTPGQAAVFYRGEEVVGGGWITGS